MVLIQKTNIVVDDFSCKGKNKNYVYFLTHMHSDHYKGMSVNWDEGRIYCTNTTKILLLNMFPGAKDIITLNYDTPTVLNLDQSGGELSVEVTFIDANHCPGSTMILFRGHMGTILHTGDMRFSNSFFNNQILYPNHSPNSIHIDQLILDNTFCDPIFKFPNFETIINMIFDLIDRTKHLNCKYAISTDSLGKEDILIQLSLKYQTQIVVNQERFKNLVSIEMGLDIFTTKEENGWIHVIQKKDQEIYKQKKDFIMIGLTGWLDTTDLKCINENQYILPYSLHSNFEELDCFVKSIKPCILTPNCVERKQKRQNIKILSDKPIETTSQFATLMRYEQKGLEILTKNYTQPNNLSQQFKSTNTEEIQKQLGFIQSDQKKVDTNIKIFNEKHQHILKKGIRLGAQIKDLSLNKNFNLEQQEFLKKLQTPIKQRLITSQTENNYLFKKSECSPFEFKRVKLFS